MAEQGHQRTGDRVAVHGTTWTDRRHSPTPFLLSAAGCAGLLVALDLIFVHTTRGQWVDDASLRGTAIGRAHIIDPVNSVLDVVSVTALGLATIAVGAVGYLRRRPKLALLTMLLVVGSNLTTEALKHVIFTRPLVDPADPLPYNTLPSGHTTVALSVGVAFTLVASARWRVLVAVIGAVYGGSTGVATMSAGWHRPSDAVAACLVVGTWTALVGAIAVLLRHVGDQPPDDTAYVIGRTAFVVLALALLAAGTLALAVTALTIHVPSSRPRLFLAYAGGASSVAGAALAAMAGLLVVARRAGTDDLDRPATTPS
jgi:membrane-associated phospholipid phosphatase